MAREEIVNDLTVITISRAEAVALIKALVEQLGGSGNTERVVITENGHVTRREVFVIDRTGDVR